MVLTKFSLVRCRCLGGFLLIPLSFRPTFSNRDTLQSIRDTVSHFRIIPIIILFHISQIPHLDNPFRPSRQLKRCDEQLENMQQPFSLLGSIMRSQVVILTQSESVLLSTVQYETQSACQRLWRYTEALKPRRQLSYPHSRSFQGHQ